jgi:hypothetical protein
LVAEDSGVDDQSKQEEERRREALKLYYDHLKHLTTLAGVTAVVELTVYRERLAELLEPSRLGISLLFLAVCVLLCLVRMAIATKGIETGEGPGDAQFLNLLFFMGLVLFVLSLVPVPDWVIDWVVYPAVWVGILAFLGGLIEMLTGEPMGGRGWLFYFAAAVLAAAVVGFFLSSYA